MTSALVAMLQEFGIDFGAKRGGDRLDSFNGSVSADCLTTRMLISRNIGKKANFGRRFFVYGWIYHFNMMTYEALATYFPSLDEERLDLFAKLEELYRTWNSRINLISRKDIDQLYEHHVLHSLAIAKLIRFQPGASILDIGTGGGFPGIPLAIMFPDVSFHLVDGTLKKIRVVQDVAEQLSLKNVRASAERVESLRGRTYDFAVSRAVATMEQLRQWSHRLLKEQHRHVLPNGLLALKGGNLQSELKALPKGEYSEVYAISDWFDLPYFHEKFVVYLQG
jgi:16S rRNA (guanine527-N7)-methyltransferase